MKSAPPWALFSSFTEPPWAIITWRVKASQIGKPRTRTLKLEALDEESACEAAKEELGDDWEILEATQD